MVTFSHASGRSLFEMSPENFPVAAYLLFQAPQGLKEKEAP